ncbi:PHP domain-containing protein [Paenibacillus sp. alder61]|uniref:PHP domain-containing protein n=1 Tax=Paenibacillus sp. alder61 TaxID=2862948 RepID=UPI001CD6D5E2|nr:PHP domain-containing protein [Paenibacillus sp. alder61]MCA1292273.1 PHP domain-containing protein [Paenibacillus sp. alder61]
MRIDLHTHAKLSKASDFSTAYYEEMIREAVANGLDAVALTEHFNTRRFFEVYENLDRMYPYNGEYYEAGSLKIFPGMEVDIRETGHILLIGRKEHILEARRHLETYTEKGRFIPFADLLTLAEAYPLLKIGAHPFRASTPLHHLDPAELRRLDAFDLNAKDMYEYGSEANRERVERFAAALGKPVTAGSDTHQCLQYGSVFNELNHPCGSVAELKQAIASGAYDIHVADSLPLQVKASVMLKKLLKRLAQLETESPAPAVAIGESSPQGA